MKIVIDSNVIISAFAGRGFCNELFELCLSEHDIYLSEYILNECEKNFKKKIKLPDSVTKEIVTYLRSTTK
jgi:predicted nucleic acid-binding protein